MPITRNSAQGPVSLEGFYQDMATRDVEQYGQHGSGQHMLRLLQRINELFKATQLWGLTSHGRLVVQAADDSASDWLVTLVAGVEGSYYVEYLLLASAQPWPDASVHGKAETLAEAERYLLIAMRESGGWAGNAELQRLLEHYGLVA